MTSVNSQLHPFLIVLFLAALDPFFFSPAGTKLPGHRQPIADAN